MASIILGLSGGWIAAVLESRGWLANQTRFIEPISTGSNSPILSGQVYKLDIPIVSLKGQGTGNQATINGPTGCFCSNTETAGQSFPARNYNSATSQMQKGSSIIFLNELFRSGTCLLVMFLGFAFIGYFLNGLIPAEWVTAVFGSGNIYSVPLAATLGLPLYINSEASLQLIRSLLDHGMSQGAALAFLISGAGTSIGAITGALTIARWRVIGLVVAILWAGAILSGFAFDFLLILKLF
jgi:hypothetical protein